MKETNDLTPLEEDILTGTHDDGMVPFPQGPVRIVERSLKALENLARRGYVRYAQYKHWYRAYWLTEKGHRIACAIRAVHRPSSPQAACCAN
jgi:hypothetical protein